MKFCIFVVISDHLFQIAFVILYKVYYVVLSAQICKSMSSCFYGHREVTWCQTHEMNFNWTFLLWFQDIFLHICFISTFIYNLVWQTGVSEQRSTNSCLFCCQKGTIIVSASIKRRAYVPGEDILISADVLNMSNTPVYRSCVKLIQVSTFTSLKYIRKLLYFHWPCL